MTWVVFDVDGTLIDVSESYDVAVKLTVEHLLRSFGRNEEVKLEWIRELRSKGTFGDDFKLSEALTLLILWGNPEEIIARFPEGGGVEWVREKTGIAIEESMIERLFNTFYLGEVYDKSLFTFPGLWRKERPLISPKLLERLSMDFKVGVVTGRSGLELKLAEKILGFRFEKRVTREDGLKPDPTLLWKLVRGEFGVYIGDTLNDETFVKRYKEKYGDFEFLMVGRDVKNVREAVENILNDGLFPTK